MDVESPAAGVLRQVGQAGTTYKVGEIIGEIAPALVAHAQATAVVGSLQRVVQVVMNLDAAIKWWGASTGAGPFFQFPHMTLARCDHLGAPVEPDISVAIGFSGETMIELVRVHDRSASAWQEAPEGALLPSILADDFDAACASQYVAGNSLLTSGVYQYGGRFAFFRSQSGTILMLVEKHFVLTQLAEKMRLAHREWDRVILTATLR